MEATNQNVSFKEESSSGSGPTVKLNNEVLALNIPELQELPNISKTEESSITPSYEEIQKIIQKNQTINQQVRLKFNMFLTKSSSLLRQSNNKTLKSLQKPSSNEKKSLASKCILSSEYLSYVKSQQETLFKLLEQLNTLQQEVTEEKAMIKRNHTEILKKRLPLAIMECSVEGSHVEKVDNVCCCKIF
ncbi:hypothetical protein SteCoe_31895 [Stentor coeruleus]|uniref:Uncharacterized protein n=1 Tax=Stentor coeruleus TaxID=5963 RepID=A0A1R2B098_9CILI|nr:hypothetical protein SteCoe_31895 [Stentor coeruleus]